MSYQHKELVFRLIKPLGSVIRDLAVELVDGNSSTFLVEGNDFVRARSTA